jgi:hypothetical protein
MWRKRIFSSNIRKQECFSKHTFAFKYTLTLQNFSICAKYPYYAIFRFLKLFYKNIVKPPV